MIVCKTVKNRFLTFVSEYLANSVRYDLDYCWSLIGRHIQVISSHQFRWPRTTIVLQFTKCHFVQSSRCETKWWWTHTVVCRQWKDSCGSVDLSDVQVMHKFTGFSPWRGISVPRYRLQIRPIDAFWRVIIQKCGISRISIMDYSKFRVSQIHPQNPQILYKNWQNRQKWPSFSWKSA